jgi:hypothetical protein
VSDNNNNNFCVETVLAFVSCRWELLDKGREEGEAGSGRCGGGSLSVPGDAFPRPLPLFASWIRIICRRGRSKSAA